MRCLCSDTAKASEFTKPRQSLKPCFGTCGPTSRGIPCRVGVMVTGYGWPCLQTSAMGSNSALSPTPSTAIDVVSLPRCWAHNMQKPQLRRGRQGTSTSVRTEFLGGNHGVGDRD